jgi:hypothetical protein
LQDEEAVTPAYYHWGITLPGVALEPDNRMGQEFCAGANATEVTRPSPGAGAGLHLARTSMRVLQFYYRPRLKFTGHQAHMQAGRKAVLCTLAELGKLRTQVKPDGGYGWSDEACSTQSTFVCEINRGWH